MTGYSRDLPLSSIKIAITGGGSGGHTSAAAGILAALQNAGLSKDRLMWIGSLRGVERGTASRLGIRYFPVQTGKLRRYLDIQNVIDLPRIAWGGFQSLRLLYRERPSSLVSTGGYVSLPVAAAAWLLKIPVIVHEQTLIPGLANRLARRLACQVILTFSESSKYFGSTPCITIGNPLRQELNPLPDRATACARLGLDASLPLLYITGGAQGSNALNRVVSRALPDLLEDWQIIHQCGTLAMEYDQARLSRMAEQLDPALRSRYHLYSYLTSEIPDIYATAQLMISRSGAATVNEIIRLGIPSILIPYPEAAENEQLRMAQALKASGAAYLIEQAEFTAEKLVDCIHQLDGTALDQMRQHARQLAPASVEPRLAAAILNIAARKTHQE